MPRGDKSKYTDKQKGQAEHIAEGYEDSGTSEKEAKRRAWATVNKETGGGKKSGSGVGKPVSHASSRKGGRLGGAAAAARPASERSASARKAAVTRKRQTSHSALKFQFFFSHLGDIAMNIRTLAALLVGGLAISATSCNTSSQGGSAGTRDSFTLTPPTMTTTLKQGDRQTVKVSLSRGSDFKKSVTIDATEPKGLTVKADKKVIAPSDPAETSVTIEAAKDAPLGEQIIKVTGTPESGSPTTVDLKVKVEQGPK